MRVLRCQRDERGSLRDVGRNYQDVWAFEFSARTGGSSTLGRRGRGGPQSGTAKSVSDITLLLQRMEKGDPDAPAELLSLVYAELRALAARKMAQEQPGQTIQATVLVHEAWYRLGGDQQPAWQSRAHFFGAVAEAMRRILIENARRKQRQKRGGQLERVDVNKVEIASPLPDDQLLALDEALDRLAAEDPRAAEIVKLCFFVGLTQQEAAEHLGTSVSTVERSWAYARAWLFREINRDRDHTV